MANRMRPIDEKIKSVSIALDQMNNVLGVELAADVDDGLVGCATDPDSALEVQGLWR